MSSATASNYELGLTVSTGGAEARVTRLGSSATATGRAFDGAATKTSKVTAATRGYSQAANAAATATARAGDAAGRAGGLWSRLTAKVTAAWRSLSKVGILAGGLSLAAIGSQVLAVNSNFEQLEVRLETVVGDRARQSFSLIKDFASTTPFQVENITEAFTRLSAIGIDPTLARLTSFGNIASAFGRDITSIAQAVQGAITGEFESLKGFGIVARVEGEQLAVTFRGVTERIDRDAASILALLERIGSTDFAGGMERQSQTLAGRFSTLKDAYASFLAAVGDTTALKEATSWLTRLIQKATEFIELPEKLSGAILDPSAIDDLELLARVFVDLQERINALGGFDLGETLDADTLIRAGLIKRLDDVAARMKELREEQRAAKDETEGHGAEVVKLGDAYDKLVRKTREQRMLVKVMGDLKLSARDAAEVVSALLSEGNSATARQLGDVVTQLREAESRARGAEIVMGLLNRQQTTAAQIAKQVRREWEAWGRTLEKIKIPGSGENLAVDLAAITAARERGRDLAFEVLDADTQIGIVTQRLHLEVAEINRLAGATVVTDEMRAELLERQLGTLEGMSTELERQQQAIGMLASTAGSVFGGLFGNDVGSGVSGLIGQLGSGFGAGGGITAYRDAVGDLNAVMAEGPPRAEELASAQARVAGTSGAAAASVAGLASAVTGLLRSTGIAQGRGGVDPLGGQTAGDYSAEAGAVGAAAGAVIGGILGAGVFSWAGAAIGAVIGEMLGTLIGSFIASGADQIWTEIRQTVEGITVETSRIYGDAEFKRVGDEFGAALVSGLEDLVSAMGGQLESLAEVNVGVRAGEFISVAFAGIQRDFEATREGFQQALEFALIQALQRSNIQGLDPRVEAAVRNFTGDTAAELESVLALALGEVEIDMQAEFGEWGTKLIRTVEGIFGRIDDLMAQGIDPSSSILASVEVIAEAQRQLTGESEDAQAAAERKAAALEAAKAIAEAEILILMAKIQAEQAALEARRAEIEAEQQIVLTEVELTRASIEARTAESLAIAATSEAVAGSARVHLLSAETLTTVYAALETALQALRNLGPVTAAAILRAERAASSAGNAARRRDREAAQHELALMEARARGDDALIERLQMEFALERQLDRLSSGLNAEQLARARVLLETEAAIAAAERHAAAMRELNQVTIDFIDRLRGNQLRETLGDFGADIAAFADELDAALAGLSGAGGGDPLEGIAQFEEIFSLLPGELSRMFRSAFEAAGDDPEALQALQDSLGALLADLPESMEPLRLLFEQFFAETSAALESASAEAAAAIAQEIRDNLASAGQQAVSLRSDLERTLARWGGQVRLTHEQQIAFLRIEFALAQAEMLARQQQLLDLIAATAALGGDVSALQEALGIIDGLVMDLLTLEPDFDSLASSTAAAAQAAAQAAESAGLGADDWERAMQSARGILDFIAGKRAGDDPFAQIRREFDDVASQLDDPLVAQALGFLGHSLEEITAELAELEGLEIQREIDRLLGGLDSLIADLQGGELSGSSRREQVLNKRAEFLELADRAAAGDVGAARQLEASGRDLLALARDISPSLYRELSNLVLQRSLAVREEFPQAILEGSDVVAQGAIVTAQDVIARPVAGEDIAGWIVESFLGRPVVSATRNPLSPTAIGSPRGTSYRRGAGREALLLPSSDYRPELGGSAPTSSREVERILMTLLAEERSRYRERVRSEDDQRREIRQREGRKERILLASGVASKRAADALSARPPVPQDQKRGR